MLGPISLHYQIEKSRCRTDSLSKFAAYLHKLFEYIHGQLKMKPIKLVQQTAYVLCVERMTLKGLYITSKEELSSTLKDCLGRFRIAVVDHSEKLVWDTSHKPLLKKPCYYVHMHISEKYIFLKHNQVVDITESNGGNQIHSSVFISDRMIKIKSMYQQVSETLWNHIELLDESKRDNLVYGDGFDNYLHDFEVFNVKLGQFLKHEVTIFRLYFFFILTM